MLKEEVSEVRKELDELQEEFGSFIAAFEEQESLKNPAHVGVAASTHREDVELDRENGDEKDKRKPQEGQ